MNDCCRSAETGLFNHLDNRELYGQLYTDVISTPMFMSATVCKRLCRPNQYEVTWSLTTVWFPGAAVLSGSSEVLIGFGKLDEWTSPNIEPKNSNQLGLLLTLREGDVIVHPAGTGHSNLSDEGHYRYLSFFPEVSIYAMRLTLVTDCGEGLTQVGN